MTAANAFLRHSFLSLLSLLVATAIWALPAERGLAAAPSGYPGGAAAALESGFRTPADADKPWVYWWWVNGNVTRESVTRDLEGMKAKGIGGFLMFDSRGYHEDHVPPPPVRLEFMSPQWREMLKFAMSEADRLGLQMSMNLSTSGGSLRAPWQTGDDAPKELIWTSGEVRGPRRVRCLLKRPEGRSFWDVALLAVRHAEPKNVKAPSQKTAEAGPMDLSQDWQPTAPASGYPAVKDAGPLAEVVDLTGRVDPQGRLTWEVPEGRWTLLRFGCRTIEGHEEDVDILNANAVENHFHRMGEAVIKDAGPLVGKTLVRFYNVSWEGASPTWTPGFEKDFQRFRGYAVRPYLPVLAGMAVTSAEVSRRFQRDFDRTLGDCFLENCYGRFRELCHRHGLKWHSESGGPWDRKVAMFAHSDQLAFWGANDMPQGEFWWARTDQTNARRTAMAAHVYGRPLAAVEAFTNMTYHWSAYPAALKPLADAAFTDGINQFIWHTFTASPKEFGKPGIEYFAGSHLNPNVTWWPQAGGILAYLGRCQHMLRQGRFVADACVYTSDRNYARWGRDQSWSPKATLQLGRGYTYDLLDTAVLVDRLAVRDGELVLPDGMRYRLLVLDPEEESLPPEALRKIVELAKGGATVVLGQRRPQQAPGLTDYPHSDAEVRRLADLLWGGPQKRSSPRSLGRGKIFSGSPLEDVLRAQNILPDFDGPWDYIHRRVNEDGLDIYFVAGSGSAECTFRVAGRQPELWDPGTGRTRVAVLWHATPDGRTAVPICLPDSGSIFVVFRKAAEPDRQHAVSVSPPEVGPEIAGRSDGGVELRLWTSDKVTIETSGHKRVSVESPVLPKPLELAGPWEVRFAPGWGAPESVVFDRLISWPEHSDPSIRHFSGTAAYRKTFTLSAQQAEGLVRLELGDVKHVAEVRLNGQSLGVVWTAPWTVDLTGAVRPGKNELEIDVTNVWANRLIGDAGLPPEKRLTQTNVPLKPGPRDRDLRPFQGYVPTDALLPSGLMGPVRLEFGRRREVRF